MELEMENIESSIRLPIFNGKLNHWNTFKEIFTELVIRNTNISIIMKFQHLLNCLEGEAYNIIRGIQILEDNFKMAWDTLVHRYDNRVLHFKYHAESLVDLPCASEESLNHIQYLLNTVNNSVEIFRTMNLPVEEWDALMVFFVERKLSFETRRDWQVEMEKDANCFPTFHRFKKFLESKISQLAEQELYVKNNDDNLAE